MRYRGEFNQLGTGDRYVVTVNMNGDRSSTPVEVVLGASPFKTNMSGDDMYKPARYSKATLQVRTSDYLMDIYAAGAQDVEVVLTKGNATIWTGYVTPNIYSMGFAYERNTIDIELVDALSTLRYYTYERSVSPIVSFADIIDKCVAKAGGYTHWYFSTNTQRSSSGTEELLSKLFISEQNFFDEKDDKNKTDEDVAWSYRDVLEAVCRFMGVTAMAIGPEVYFIDWDALKAGSHQYYRYAVGTSGGTLVTKGGARSIASTDFSGNGSNISLGQIYNKVTVDDSLYDFDEIIPSLFDTNLLTNVTDTDTSGTYGSSSWMVSVLGTTQAGRQLKVLTTSNDAKYKNFVKFFKNPKYTLHQYTVSGSNLVESTQDAANYTRIMNTIGGYLMGVSVSKVSEYSQSPSSVSFTNYFVIRWNSFDGTSGQGRNDLTADDKYPMIETNDTSDVTAFFGGSGAYLIIQGKVRCLAVPECFPPSDVRVDDKAHNNFGDRMWLPAQLKLGNYYWNGSSWQTAACKFKLPFSEADHLDTGNPDDTDGGLDADKFYNKDFPFRNTVTYEDGLDEDGYAIPLSSLPLTMAKPKFIIYNPHHMVKDNTLDSVWISGLKIVAAIGNPDNEDKSSDTEYVNEISNGSIKEASKVEMKICTWDNKKPNYSAPAYISGNVFDYVQKLYNRACQAGENSLTGVDGSSGANGLRQEEHLIYRMVNQYSTPAVILQLPLRADHSPLDRYTYSLEILSGKTFVVNQLSTDYRRNTCDVKLMEKK